MLNFGSMITEIYMRVAPGFISKAYKYLKNIGWLAGLLLTKMGLSLGALFRCVAKKMAVIVITECLLPVVFSFNVLAAISVLWLMQICLISHGTIYFNSLQTLCVVWQKNLKKKNYEATRFARMLLIPVFWRQSKIPFSVEKKFSGMVARWLTRFNQVTKGPFLNDFVKVFYLLFVVSLDQMIQYYFSKYFLTWFTVSDIIICDRAVGMQKIPPQQILTLVCSLY